jgi:uncharacterized protein (TIGR03437 family)
LQVSEGAESVISLAPGAMSFTAVSGGIAPATQILNVFNFGTGQMSWSAQASTLNQSPWLQLSSGASCMDGGQSVTGMATSGGLPGSMTVCVDPKQARPGANYGQIAVSASNAGNSPETITVLFNLLATGTPVPEVAFPTGVVLQATKGSSAAVQPAVNCTNFNADSVGFHIISVTDTGNSWLTTDIPGQQGTLPGQITGPLHVLADATALDVGTYHGQIRIGFTDGTTPVIDVILVVSESQGSTAAPAHAQERPRTSPPNCPGGSVLPPQFIDVYKQGFQVEAGGTSTLLVQVHDTCGNAITDADPHSTMNVIITTPAEQTVPELFYSAAQNAWVYGWQPTMSDMGPVTLQAVAALGLGGAVIGGRSDIWSGSVTAAAAGGAAEPTAVGSAADTQLANGFTAVNQVAAGSYISISGYDLADGLDSHYPWPMQDQGAYVTLGGVPLMLEYVSPGQVNALIPTTGLPMNAPLPLKILRDGTQSLEDLQISVTSLQPAIFLAGDQSLPEQGAVLIANTSSLAAPAGFRPGSVPVPAGGYIEIYCNGLGPVNNPPPDGQLAGYDLVADTTTTTPHVFIGNPAVEVPAVLYSGLAPGLSALYQVDIQVPAGTPPGDAIPIMIQMTTPAGAIVSSNTATIAVQ